MNISLSRHISDGIRHRYLTGLNVRSEELSGKLVDTLAPTYMADYTQIHNFDTRTMSPMLATLIGVRHIPFNVMLRIAGVDMSKLKVAMRKLKEKELTFVSVGYGGLSINVLHFLSLLAYRVNVDDVFKKLHIYEEDNISFTNIMRIYKDLTHFQCSFGDRLNKLHIFEDENLAEKVMLHKYYLKEEFIGDVGDDVVFFGAPDFETRDMLQKYNFIFGGHSGNNVAFVYKPKVDSDLTIESYGTINLGVFFLNMLKAAEHLVYTLLDDYRKEDEVIFEFNAKKMIEDKYEKVEEQFGKDVHSYVLTDELQIVV